MDEYLRLSGKLNILDDSIDDFDLQVYNIFKYIV